MGGRGSSSGSGGGGAGSSNNNGLYKTDYQPYAYGQITKYEAGVVYRAMKEGNIKVLPETTRELYNQTEDMLMLATSRYNQAARYYDQIYDIVDNILAKDYKTAQKIINAVEKKNIELAGKKSAYYKYKKK